MRKILLSLALCLCFSAMYAYTPMLRNGYTWTYSKCRKSLELPSVHPNPPKYYYAQHGAARLRNYQYTLYFDTIMNGFTYYHFTNTTCDEDYMLRENKNNPYIKQELDNYKPDNSRYLLREDTLQQKVFIYDKNNGKERLLYDFSLNVGDSTQVFFRLVANNFEMYRVSLDWLHSWWDYWRIVPSSMMLYIEEKYKPKEEQGKLPAVYYTLDEEMEKAYLDSLLGPIDAADSAIYSTIYITDIDSIVDAFGDTIKIFSYTQKNLWGFENTGTYYERYGCMYGFFWDYISYKEMYIFDIKGYVDYFFRCGLNEYGQPGLHEQGHLYNEDFDCFFDDYSFPESAPFTYMWDRNDLDTQELAWPHWVLRYP